MRINAKLIHTASRPSFFIVWILSMLLAVQSIAGIYTFDSKQKSDSGIFDITHIDSTKMEIQLNICDFRFEQISRASQQFAFIEITDAGKSVHIGKATLPVIRQWIQVPLEASIQINTAEVETQTIFLSDLHLPEKILPLQKPVAKLPHAKLATPFAMDHAYYNSQKWDKAPLIQVAETGMVRGARTALLEIHPVSYQPATGTIQVTHKAQITIHFEDADWKATQQFMQRYADPQFDSQLSMTLPNYPLMASKGLPEVPGGYLIIAAEHLAGHAALEEFIHWKRRTGYEVNLLTTAETTSDAQTIKVHVQNAYDTWEYPPVYLLLIGDTAQIGFFTGESWDWPATDLYYATTAGADPYPDLWVGRLPVLSDADLDNALGKILSFEEVQWQMADTWQQHAVFVTSSDHFYVTEATHNHVIGNYLDPAGYISEKLYSNTHNANTGQIVSTINTGLSLVVYSGHGEATFWVDPYFDANNIYALESGIFPVVNSFACLTGKYPYDGSFAETWIRAAGGAVSFFGASENSYWDEDDILERSMFEAFFAGSTQEGGVNLTWLSAMNRYGIGKVGQSFGGETALLYSEMYNLMGDPSLDVWTAPPTVITPQHESRILAGDTSLTVDAGVANARVGLATDEATYGCAYTGEDGIATVNFIRPPSKNGTMYLTVTGHNLQPYKSDLSVLVSAYDVEQFTAQGGPELIDLYWTVTGEDDIKGYNLLRSESEQGTFAQVNEELITVHQKGSYSYTDEGLAAGSTYWYKLEIITLDDFVLHHGPVSATTSGEDGNTGDDDTGESGCGCS